jgi:hypothetical protein
MGRAAQGASGVPPLLRLVEAVAQTPGEPVRPFPRVGSENAHLVRHAHVVRREVVAHGSAGVPFRERAAAFPRRLYATASAQSDMLKTRSASRGRRPYGRMVRPVLRRSGDQGRPGGGSHGRLPRT